MDGPVCDDLRTLTGADVMDHLADIQGNILKPYTFALQRAIFLKVDDAASGRAWLEQVLPSVTSAERWPEGARPDKAISLGLSIFGLRMLGVSS